MSKRQLLTILGLWFMFFLFLGFPSTWHKIIAIISGLIIIIISYNLPHEERKNNGSGTSFIENNKENI